MIRLGIDVVFAVGAELGVDVGFVDCFVDGLVVVCSLGLKVI